MCSTNNFARKNRLAPYVCTPLSHCPLAALTEREFHRRLVLYNATLFVSVVVFIISTNLFTFLPALRPGNNLRFDPPMRHEDGSNFVADGIGFWFAQRSMAMRYCLPSFSWNPLLVCQSHADSHPLPVTALWEGKSQPCLCFFHGSTQYPIVNRPTKHFPVHQFSTSSIVIVVLPNGMKQLRRGQPGPSR